jgi:hypothetical protein
MDPTRKPADADARSNRPVRSAYLDLPRLGFFTLVERNRQHAVLEVGLDGLIVNGWRKRKAAEEAAVAALVQQVLALLLVFLFAVAFGRDGQGRILQGDIKVSKSRWNGSMETSPNERETRVGSAMVRTSFAKLESELALPVKQRSCQRGLEMCDR